MLSAMLVFSQLLNGLQYGVLLFLLAAGLTLVFGIMSFVNLAHGALYMMGAYFAALTFKHTESLTLAFAAAVVGSFGARNPTSCRCQVGSTAPSVFLG